MRKQSQTVIRNVPKDGLAFGLFKEQPFNTGGKGGGGVVRKISGNSGKIKNLNPSFERLKKFNPSV